jgi:hypothetical protein
MIRFSLLAFCGIAGCLAAWNLIAEAAKTLNSAQNWKRRTVKIWGSPDGGHVRVKWGTDDEHEASVVVSPFGFYSDYSNREMLENPADANDKRLDGLLDLWYLPITWTVALMLLAASSVLIWQTPFGEDREWQAGEWVQPLQPLPPMRPSIAEVRPPVEYWKAKVLYTFLLGIPLFLGGLYNFRSSLIAGIILGWLGTIVLGWFVFTALDHYSEVVWAGEQGFEKRSVWGRKQAKWSDVSSVVYEDAMEYAKRVAREEARRRPGKLPARLPDLYRWSIQDKEGIEIIALDVESRSKDQLEKLLEKARSVTDRRGSAEGTTR